MLGPDETFASALEATVRDFEDRTQDEWTEWSRALHVPFEWQDAVIRAAIALKLCSFEETGAVVAALTTSIPEAAGTERNWDYRYCWLRDATFVIHALNRLGATRTMEGYLGYLTDLVAGADGHLQPVYGIGLENELTERIEPALAGYRGMGPVRVGNQAWEHIQNDAYGSVVLAATQAFFDRAAAASRRSATLRAARGRWRAGDRALEPAGRGLWEFRTRAQVHTLSPGHVLGGVRSAGAHRRPPRTRARGAALGLRGLAHPRRDLGAGVEREARLLHGGVRQRDPGRFAAPAARARLRARRRSALSRHAHAAIEKSTCAAATT